LHFINKKEMKVAIVGGRNFTNFNYLEAKILEWELTHEEITHVVSGGAIGTDKLAEKFAKKYDLELTVFLPQLDKYSRRVKALMARNTDIIKDPEYVIAFWDGKSSGTKDSITKARQMGIPVKVFRF
jgi:predicted Rossmann fold nucleotide-binding protein DprA/Smf involved in DNA uptake